MIGQILSRGYNAPIAMWRPDGPRRKSLGLLREAARAARNYRLPGTTFMFTLGTLVPCAFAAMVQARIWRACFWRLGPEGRGSLAVQWT